MNENKRQTEERTQRQNSDDRNIEESSHEVVKGNPEHQRGSANTGSASSMDEKSSGIGRRDKGTGLATKDGVTGSDYDGQLAE